MKLFIALRAETLKTKRTASVYLSLICAAIIPLILLFNVLLGGSDLAAIRHDPFHGLFKLGAERSGIVFFPLFVILLGTLLPQIEYRNNTWKQVLAAPQSKGNIFMARFITLNGFILLFQLAHLLFMFVSALIIDLYYPQLDLLHRSFNFNGVWITTANAYITILALSSLQFWLGLRFRNFIIPMAIGLVLLITGIMMAVEVQSDLIKFFPYSFQVFPYASTLQAQVPHVLWLSLGYTSLFLILGFLDFKRRRTIH